MSEVLDSPEVREVLAQIAADTGRPVDDVMAEARADLDEMAVRPGRFSVAGWDRFCRWLQRAYRLDYRPQEVEELRRLNEHAALIFLPNHRSYLDPMFLRSALMAHGFAPNHVLGGANLAIWPMSAVGQRNGIVFIRREFRDDPVYRAVLRAYLGHLLREKKNLEWYFEGGRTRSGKLRPPKLGVLSYVMDAYAQTPDVEVLVVPTSVVYDQQHEVSAISAEEMGGRKKPESIKWLYEFATSQSRRLGRAYIRFGEPLSLRDAVALTADQEGDPRPRLAVPKVAFEVADRINEVTPISPGALITFALLDNGDRAITVDEGRQVLEPLLDYITLRGLPMTEPLDLARHGTMSTTLRRLVGEGVVTVYTGGTEPVYSVDRAKQHEAAFYRNTIVHFFLNRAITELAALQAAEDRAEDIPAATWANARALEDLLKFEFFFPGTRKFADQVAYETSLMYPGWQEREFTWQQVNAELASVDMLLAHRVIGPFLEAYSVFADELAALGDEPADEAALIEASLGIAQQRWLQRQLPTPESISRDYFRNAAQLAANRDLIGADAPDLAARRAAFADQLGAVVRRLDILRKYAQASGQPVLTERAPTTQGGRDG